MKMKKLNIYIIGLLTLMLCGIQSCALESEVFDEITPSIYPQTERDVRDLVTGNAYSPFQNYDYGGLYNVANGVMLISDMATEYGFCSWGGWIWEPLEFARWTPSDEDRIAYPWTNYLKGISKMTLTIDRITNVNMNKDLLNQYIAELRCARGFLAFLLYDLYGPIIVADLETLKNAEDEIILPRLTASGKTPFAAALAAELHTEIISADSRQIYRGMDLGTGKDLADYTVDGKQIPYHLIDIADPGYKYNVFEYQRDFLNAYETIKQKGCLPVVCGGTGMYLESVLKGYRLLPVPENPELRTRLADKSLEELTDILKGYKSLHNTTDVDTAKRAIRAIEIEEYYAHTPVDERSFPQMNSLIIGVDIDRELRREKITRRLHQRLEEGMIDEVRRLIEQGIQPDDLIYYGLEYKYLTLYVIGKLTYEEMFTQLETAIHQFAKRQMTWFRGMERRGFTIHWMNARWPMEEKIAFVKKKLEG